MKRKDLNLLPPEEMFSVVSQLLSEGYDVEFTVTGNSMWPLLASVRDRVTLRKAPENSLKKGEIVLLKGKHGYLLHRIARIKGAEVQTFGDGNCYYDEYEPADAVIGRVVSFNRKGRQVSCDNPLYRLSSFLWRVFFPLRPVLLRILYRFRRRRK